MKQHLITFLQDIPLGKLTILQSDIKTLYSSILFNQAVKSLVPLLLLNIDDSLDILLDLIKDKTIIMLTFSDSEEKIYIEKDKLGNIEFFNILMEEINVKGFMNHIPLTNIKYNIMKVIVDSLDNGRLDHHINNFTDLFFTADYLLDVKLMNLLMILFFKDYPRIFETIAPDYHAIYRFCDILHKNGKIHKEILLLFKNLNLQITKHKQSFFNSSLYQYFLSISTKFAHSLVINYQYFPSFPKIINDNNSDQLVSLLLKGKQFDLIKTLYNNDHKMIENAILSSYDDMTADLITLEPVSNHLLLAFALKFDLYYLNLIDGPITHPVLIAQLNKYIEQLLTENNCIISLSLLHENLGKVFENTLISLIDKVPIFIFKMNVEKFSDDLLWQLILKFEKYDYLSLLKPTNKYTIPSPTTIKVFNELITNLLNLKTFNTYGILQQLQFIFGIIVENTLIGLIELVGENIMDTDLSMWSNEFILLLIIKFNKPSYINMLNKPLSKIAPITLTSNYLNNHLGLFMENHIDTYTTMYQLLGDIVDDKIIGSDGLFEALYLANIVSPRLQSVLTLKYGTIEEARKVVFSKNVLSDRDVFFYSKLYRLLNMSKYCEVKTISNDVLFLEYCNTLPYKDGLLPKITEMLNFVDYRSWQYVGTGSKSLCQSNISVKFTSNHFTLKVGQEVLIKNNQGIYKIYTIDQLKFYSNKPMDLCSITFKDAEYLYGHFVMYLLEDDCVTQ